VTGGTPPDNEENVTALGKVGKRGVKKEKEKGGNETDASATTTSPSGTVITYIG
jgi:hypothetical protein